MATRVWVTGAGGLIGSHLVRIASLKCTSWQVQGLTRADLDLEDASAVEERFRADVPDLIVHCAALSRSPECQANPERAWRINVTVTEHLARLAADRQFIFFSTDLVFDGQAGSYSETAEVNPLSVYGETKVAAEKIVLANPRHTVVRTSLNAGPSPTGDRGLDEQLIAAARKGAKLRLFTDEYRCPISAGATAQMVLEIAAGGLTGLYHVAGAERLSRWEIGQCLVHRYPELAGKMEPSSTKEYPGAPRPADTSMDCRKIQQHLSFPLPKFSEWVRSEGVFKGRTEPQ